ncbi:MAG: rRNA cytosine-C5-methylase, partial [Rhodospirillaceae bacterium]
MTPAGRLQASIELLAAVLSDPRPADGVVSAFLRARRYMGAKDRRDVTERVWSILRSRERLDWHLQKFGLDPVQPRAFVLAHGVVCDGLTPSTLATLCTGERFAPAPLKPREEDWLKALAGQALEHPDMPRAVRLECPSWLLPRLETALAHQGGPGDGQLDGTSDGTSEEPDQAKDPDAEIAALTLGMAPVDLRANLLKATREQTTNLLTKEGISAEPGPLSPWALRLAERPHLAETKAFKEGFVEVQDASSQVAALLCGVGPGLSVLD